MISLPKVKDTASFIARAKAVHGDKYDYSQTVYIGANMPIQIICKVHGVFTLGWTASHYTKKGSGCQKCSGCEAKVRDTESFIRAATQLHGNKYDYSQSVYVASQKPITIICKKCGPFVLAEAGSHYGKKSCGCRTCGIQETNVYRTGTPKKLKTCKCGFVGFRECFPHNAKGVCVTCHRESLAAKQLRMEKRLERECPVCGNAINSKDLKKVTCSVQCRIDRIKVPRVTAHCCVCEKPIQKYRCKVKENNCCSLDCQRVWSLKINRGVKESDWIARSRNAKKKWKANRRKERERFSEVAKWRRKANAEIMSLQESKESPWVRRAQSASSMLKQRLEPSEMMYKTQVATTWEKTSSTAYQVLTEKTKRSNRTSWLKKIAVVQGGIRRRRQLRLARVST